METANVQQFYLVGKKRLKLVARERAAAKTMDSGVWWNLCTEDTRHDNYRGALRGLCGTRRNGTQRNAREV